MTIKPNLITQTAFRGRDVLLKMFFPNMFSLDCHKSSRGQLVLPSSFSASHILKYSHSTTENITVNGTIHTDQPVRALSFILWLFYGVRSVG